MPPISMMVMRLFYGRATKIDRCCSRFRDLHTLAETTNTIVWSSIAIKWLVPGLRIVWQGYDSPVSPAISLEFHLKLLDKVEIVIIERVSVMRASAGQCRIAFGKNVPQYKCTTTVVLRE
jgi:hypothetical protein